MRLGWSAYLCVKCEALPTFPDLYSCFHLARGGGGVFTPPGAEDPSRRLKHDDHVDEGSRHGITRSVGQSQRDE